MSPAKKAAAKDAADAPPVDVQPAKDALVDDALAEQEKADAAVVEADKLADPDDAARADLDAARDAFQSAQAALSAARIAAIAIINDEAGPVVADLQAAVKDVVNAARVARAASDTHVAAHEALDANDYGAARAALASKRPDYLLARADQVADHPKKGK